MSEPVYIKILPYHHEEAVPIRLSKNAEDSLETIVYETKKKNMILSQILTKLEESNNNNY